jgi:hypothetical protein
MYCSRSTFVNFEWPERQNMTNNDNGSEGAVRLFTVIG